MVAVVTSVQAQELGDFELTSTLAPSSVTGDDDFGGALALDGGQVLVGSKDFGTLGQPGYGRAYLFDADRGSLLQTFDSPSPFPGERFGESVDLSGGRALIGASLFDATNGRLLRTFDDPTPANRAPDRQAVALEGDKALINGFGKVNLFDASSGSLLHTFENPAPAIGDRFGRSVALQGDRALVGVTNDIGVAPGEDRDPGSAHLFDATSGALLQSFTSPTPDEVDLFGEAVALDGNRVLIGARADSSLASAAGRAYLFDASTGALLQTFENPTPTNGEDFGTAVAIDGDNVLIGAPFEDTVEFGSGQAYLFDALSGELIQTLENPGVPGFDFFGSAVAIDDDLLAIGASSDSTVGFRAGQAYVFIAAPIPEPSTWGMMIAGLGLIGLFTQRRRRKTTA